MLDTIAKLIAEEGIQKGLVLSLENGNEWVVGRDPESCQFIIEDPSASRKHLVIRETPEGILLENLSDTNPTQINGEDISEPHMLSQGDEVRIGNGLFRFYAEPEAHVIEDEEVEVEKKETGAAVVDEKEEEPHYDTIFEDEEEDAHERKKDLAEVNFDLTGTGRWLLKVISGPNNGAEFSMQSGAEYLVGTEPSSCDIVFHDNSVSRQHARISIDDEENVTIQDLNSRNGTLVDGKRIESPEKLETNTLISTGTTSFIIFDREGEMQTIISPLLPSIVKALKPEEEGKEEEENINPPSPEMQEAANAALRDAVIKPAKEKTGTTVGAFILIGIIMGFFVIAGIGTTLLFRSEPIEIQETVNIDKALNDAIIPFPNVKYSFNKSTGRLLLVGHVLMPTDKRQLLYNLQGLKFIKNIDDTGIIIDEYVWRETNQVIAKNRDWKSVTVHAPSAGRFVLSGYLKTRGEAEELSDYINTNFPYLDLLEKRIIVEEDMVNSLTIELQNHGFSGVNVQMSDGLLTLTGAISPKQVQTFNTFVDTIKSTPGIRSVKTFVSELAPEKSVINISDTYQVSGVSQIGKNLNVIINGRILAKGDSLDGMKITEINRNTVWLEKDNVKYRIDH